jgi:hypothetical protein
MSYIVGNCIPVVSRHHRPQAFLTSLEYHTVGTIPKIPVERGREKKRSEESAFFIFFIDDEVPAAGGIYQYSNLLTYCNLYFAYYTEPVSPARESIMSSNYGKALFDFSPTAPNQLPLQKGESIEVLKHGPTGGWSHGRSTTGKLSHSDLTNV